MIFYNAAANSLEVEKEIVETFKHYYKTLRDAQLDSPSNPPDWNTYQVEITVTQVDPPL